MQDTLTSGPGSTRKMKQSGGRKALKPHKSGLLYSKTEQKERRDSGNHRYFFKLEGGYWASVRTVCASARVPRWPARCHSHNKILKPLPSWRDAYPLRWPSPSFSTEAKSAAVQQEIFQQQCKIRRHYVIPAQLRQIWASLALIISAPPTDPPVYACIIAQPPGH